MESEWRNNIEVFGLGGWSPEFGGFPGRYDLATQLSPPAIVFGTPYSFMARWQAKAGFRFLTFGGFFTAIYSPVVNLPIPAGLNWPYGYPALPD